jgi:hypothetical protein
MLIGVKTVLTPINIEIVGSVNETVNWECKLNCVNQKYG